MISEWEILRIPTIISLVDYCTIIVSLLGKFVISPNMGDCVKRIYLIPLYKFIIMETASLFVAEEKNRNRKIICKDGIHH